MEELSELKRMILDALDKTVGIELVIVFGSLAARTARPESDLDLAIDIGHAMSVEERILLIDRLADRVGRPVDLIDLRTVGEPLLGQILAGGKRILGSDERYASLLRKHLFDAADFLPYRDRILEERRRAWIGA